VAEVALKANNPIRLSDEATRIAQNDLVTPTAGWQIYNYLIRRHLV
jgi:hypothetical protein